VAEALLVCKLLGVATLFAGTLGSFVARDLADRRRFAYALAGPGFGVTWACGFGLAALEERSLLSTFILLAMVLSLASLQVVLYSVGKEGRRSALVALLAIAPLVITVALMVTKP
jgi:hypothetical protein